MKSLWKEKRFLCFFFFMFKWEKNFLWFFFIISKLKLERSHTKAWYEWLNSELMSPTVTLKCDINSSWNRFECNSFSAKEKAFSCHSSSAKTLGDTRSSSHDSSSGGKCFKCTRSWRWKDGERERDRLQWFKRLLLFKPKIQVSCAQDDGKSKTIKPKNEKLSKRNERNFFCVSKTKGKNQAIFSSKPTKLKTRTWEKQHRTTLSNPLWH